MTLNTSGPISLNDILEELGLPAGTPISWNDENFRALAGKPTGPIVLPDDFWGKSALREFNWAFPSTVGGLSTRAWQISIASDGSVTCLRTLTGGNTATNTGHWTLVNKNDNTVVEVNGSGYWQNCGSGTAVFSGTSTTTCNFVFKQGSVIIGTGSIHVISYG